MERSGGTDDEREVQTRRRARRSAGVCAERLREIRPWLAYVHSDYLLGRVCLAHSLAKQPDVPAHMNLEEAALVEPVAVAVQITKVGKVKPNQTVVVLGGTNTSSAPNVFAKSARGWLMSTPITFLAEYALHRMERSGGTDDEREVQTRRRARRSAGGHWSSGVHSTSSAPNVFAKSARGWLMSTPITFLAEYALHTACTSGASRGSSADH
jgi:hypothetical protein